MSRNLCSTKCYYCDTAPVLVETPREIAEADVGPYYFEEYRGMTVANAECPLCLAKYLAWVDNTVHHRHHGAALYKDMPFVDLSFRSSFNDEPGDEDLPVYWIETKIEKIRHPFAERPKNY